MPKADHALLEVIANSAERMQRFTFPRDFPVQHTVQRFR